MAKGHGLEDRLLDFAVRVIRLCAALPRQPAARHIRDQLLCCGTAAAPNCAEARGAESRRDFVHKLRIVLKELNESRAWLKMILGAQLLSARRMQPILDECDELCRVIGRSVKTARDPPHR